MAAQTPRGIRNNNPLNIRKGNNWQGERHPQTDPAFEEFRSLELGLRAGFIILRNYIKARPPVNTIAKIITRWAPPSENNTQRYIQVVSKRSGIAPDTIIKFEQKNLLCRMVQAMCWQECGVEISFGKIENAYALANYSDATLHAGGL